MSQALVVDKEKAAVTNDWTTERSTEVVTHEMIRFVHLVERPRVEGVVAQKLVSSAVKLIRAAARDDVDLTAAGAADVGRVTSGLDLELLHAIRRRTEVE